MNDDLISRQAVIDAVEFGITYAKAFDVNTGESKELFKEGNDALKKAVERLKALPSAEPRHNFPEKAQLSGKDTTSDCISRQTAIDALGERPDVWTDSEGELAEARQWEYDVAAIKAVPSAQPESDDWSEYSGKLWKAAYERGKKDAEQPEWIPTSKKLPKINQPVLVWTSGDYWLAELHLLDDVFYWDFDTFDLSGDEFNDVIAWMPLPKPYKEGK